VLFIGSLEQQFIENRRKYHEINLVFQAKTKASGMKIESKEKHLQFFLFTKKQLIRQTILPNILKGAVLKWFRNKKIFWVSQWK